MNGNLNTAQFGGAPPATPSSHPIEPRAPATSVAPMPIMASTYSSADRTTAWRKPPGVQPATSATYGSLFHPVAS